MNILGLNAYHGDALPASPGWRHWLAWTRPAPTRLTILRFREILEHSSGRSCCEWRFVPDCGTRWLAGSATSGESHSLSAKWSCLAEPDSSCREHHRAHLASAFFASPFEEAAVVSVDGFGDLSSVISGVGMGNRLKVLGSVQFPPSLGVFLHCLHAVFGNSQVRR